MQKSNGIFFRELISEYCANATIHGIPYISDSKRTWIERLYWLIGFIFSLIACMYLISKTWIKWKENPVIVSFDQEHTAVWKIPFPAVTICPLNKINQYKFNYTQWHNIIISDKVPGGIQETHLSEIEIQKSIETFFDISLICNENDEIRLPERNFTDEKIFSLIHFLAPKLEETITEIMWKNEKYTIVSDKNHEKNIFHEHVTSDGLCFTFNALNHNDMYTDQVKPDLQFIRHNKRSTGWSVEGGYSDNNYANSFPERTSQAGLLFGLSTKLMIAANEREGFCGYGVAGFKVLLHNPAEVPRLSEQYFLAPAKQQIIVAVTPKVIKTSKDLAKISPHTRNCYFAHERQLRFFKIYTQYNCKTECEANITRQHCDCLPFYLPRDNDTKICAFGKKGCLDEAKNQIFKYENMLKNRKIAMKETEKKELHIFQQCNCLASCMSLEYETEVSQAEFLSQISRTSRNISVNSAMIEITPMNIFFKESQFLALDRSELYGQTHFIANIGGVLGLFLGFSVLSFLEIVYFFTLRMWCKLYKERKINNRIKPKPIYNVPISVK